MKNIFGSIMGLVLLILSGCTYLSDVPKVGTGDRKIDSIPANNQVAAKEVTCYEPSSKYGWPDGRILQFGATGGIMTCGSDRIQCPALTPPGTPWCLFNPNSVPKYQGGCSTADNMCKTENPGGPVCYEQGMQQYHTDPNDPYDPTLDIGFQGQTLKCGGLDRDGGGRGSINCSCPGNQVPGCATKLITIENGVIVHRYEHSCTCIDATKICTKKQTDEVNCGSMCIEKGGDKDQINKPYNPQSIYEACLKETATQGDKVTCAALACKISGNENGSISWSAPVETSFNCPEVMGLVDPGLLQGQVKQSCYEQGKEAFYACVAAAQKGCATSGYSWDQYKAQCAVYLINNPPPAACAALNTPQGTRDLLWFIFQHNKMPQCVSDKIDEWERKIKILQEGIDWISGGGRGRVSR